MNGYRRIVGEPDKNAVMRKEVRGGGGGTCDAELISEQGVLAKPHPISLYNTAETIVTHL